MSKKSETPEPAEGAADVTADIVGTAAEEHASTEVPPFFAEVGAEPTATHTQVTPVLSNADGATATPPGYVPPTYAAPAYSVAAPVPPGAVPPGAATAVAPEPADDSESKARKRTLITALVGAGVGLIAGLSLGIGGTMLASDDHDGRGFDSGQVQGQGGRHGGFDQQQGNQQGGQQQGNQQGGFQQGGQQGGQVPSNQQQGNQQGGFQQGGAVPGGQMPGGQGPGGMSRSGGS